VAAGLPVHRADIQARAAAHAPERLPGGVVGEQARPAVVDEDHVNVLGTVRLIRAPRALDERHVVADGLSGGGARGELHEPGEVLEARHELLDAHEGDVHAREGRGEADVPLVLDQRDGTGVRR
jgi:hypothetical protein